MLLLYNQDIDFSNLTYFDRVEERDVGASIRGPETSKDNVFIKIFSISWF